MVQCYIKHTSYWSLYRDTVSLQCLSTNLQAVYQPGCAARVNIRAWHDQVLATSTPCGQTYVMKINLTEFIGMQNILGNFEAGHLRDMFCPHSSATRSQPKTGT